MNLRPFELALVVVFIFLILGSLFFLSIYKAPASKQEVTIGVVEIWGTLPSEGFSNLIQSISETNPAYKNVTYRTIPDESFNAELVNALADGTGPDMVLIPHESLVAMRKRIQPISYESFPLRDVKDIYVDGAQIFALSDGLYGYPIFIDPLVMYWNRDMLTSDGFVAPPTTWEALVSEYLPTLVRRGDDRSVSRSVVALGEYTNVRNSFAIISALLLQAGSRGVVDVGEGQYDIGLNQTVDGNAEPLMAVADFYTRFNRPSNEWYSWNRSFSGDRDRFLSEDLAFYFGFGSEGRELERLNPNLNFDIVELPQGATATVRRTYATVYGLAPLRSSDNKAGAIAVMQALGGRDSVAQLATIYNMAPTFRDQVGSGSDDIYGRVYYKSAVVAYGWLNPATSVTDEIFRTMTKDMSENRMTTSEAVGDVLDRLELEYNK